MDHRQLPATRNLTYRWHIFDTSAAGNAGARPKAGEWLPAQRAGPNSFTYYMPMTPALVGTYFLEVFLDGDEVLWGVGV